jgi:hypothetical protein
MAIKEYRFTGYVTYAFLNKENMYGKYSLNFYPNGKEVRKAVVDTGTRCKPKLDKNDDIYFTFTNKDRPVFHGVDEGTIVGDGSEVTVSLTVEDFVSKEHGNVTRTLLAMVEVLNLVPYESKEKPQASAELPA